MKKVVIYVSLIVITITMSCKKEKYTDALGNVDETRPYAYYQDAFVGTYMVGVSCIEKEYGWDQNMYLSLKILKTSARGLLEFNKLTDATGYGTDKVVEIAPDIDGNFKFSSSFSSTGEGKIDVQNGTIQYHYTLGDYNCSCSGYKN